MSKSINDRPRRRAPRAYRARPLLVATGALLVFTGCESRLLGRAPQPCETETCEQPDQMAPGPEPQDMAPPSSSTD